MSTVVPVCGSVWFYCNRPQPFQALLQDHVVFAVFALVIVDVIELGYLADTTRRSVYQGESIRTFEIVGLTGCSLNVVLLLFMCATFLFTFRDEKCHMFLDTIWTL